MPDTRKQAKWVPWDHHREQDDERIMGREDDWGVVITQATADNSEFSFFVYITGIRFFLNSLLLWMGGIVTSREDKERKVKQRVCDWRNGLFLFLVLLVVGTGVGCAAGNTTIAPPTIRYGEDLCAECGMIISDPRYAAGYAYEVGEGRYESLAFDDIGDLLAHMTKHPERNVVAWYVHDYASEEWLDATTAYYVVSETIHTPMGHGIAAHATEAAAAAMAEEQAGVVFDWAGLLALSNS